MKEVTIVFPILKDTGRILLAMKKLRFGAGKYNGMGGKIEEGETVREAAVREAKEEVGIDILPEDLIPAADITFLFDEKPEWEHHCHVFLAYQWSGEPVESDEMSPEYFKIDELPFDRMWVSDPVWLPAALAEKRVKGSVNLSADGNAIEKTDIHENELLSF